MVRFEPYLGWCPRSALMDDQAMEAKARREALMYIASVREDLRDDEQQLRATREDIARALKAAEDLAIEACALRVRTKELEMDEEVLKKSQEVAIQEKMGAEKRLMEVGGYESAVRVLQKELRNAKSELERTKNEKLHIMSEEKKLHSELVQLNALLGKIRAHSAELQVEYNAVMKDKQETDSKLHKLSQFLQKTLETSSMTSSPKLSPPSASPPNVSPTKSATAISSSGRVSSSSEISIDTSKRSPRSSSTSSSPTRKFLAYLSSRRQSLAASVQDKV